MKLFGRKKKPNAQDTIAKQREALEMLDKKEQFLDKKIQHEVAEAKRLNAAGNKRGAIACLKRKKMYVDQQSKIAGAREKIEMQLMAIESADMNMQVLDTLQEGSKTMKEMHRGMSVEKVDKVMDDINDEMMVSQEISDALGQSLGDPIDEDDLLDELDQLENEGQEEALGDLDDLEIDTPVKTKAGGKNVSADDELAELEEAMV